MNDDTEEIFNIIELKPTATSPQENIIKPVEIAKTKNNKLFLNFVSKQDNLKNLIQMKNMIFFILLEI